MNPVLLSWWLSTTVIPSAAAPGLVREVPLLAGEPDYVAQKAPEIIYEGFLQQQPDLGPPGRFHPYRLSVRERGRGFTYLLYLPGKGDRLEAWVGQEVRLAGKLVPVGEGAQRIQELWPAYLELPNRRGPGADGIYARAAWQPTADRVQGTRYFVFRDGAGLARAMHITGESAAETATKLLARQLRVPAIDWKKQMLVTVTAGLRGAEADRLIITQVAPGDGTLTITYKLEATKGAEGFGYPSESVLVNRHDGAVRLTRTR
jgi:hypothetical protein